MTATEVDTPTLAPATPLQEESPYAPVPRGLLIGLALFFVLVIAGVYRWNHSAPTPDSNATRRSDVTGTPSVDPEKVEAMVKSLSERLKNNPADAGGWAMLARTYSVVGRASEAADAYAHAVQLSAGDAALLVDYADAWAVKNNRSMEGEPMQLVQRALKLDPNNVKGLAIAGKYSFDHKDYVTAIKHWDKVVANGGTENFFAKQIQADLDMARAMSGIPSSGKVSAAVKSSAEIGATISLVPALLGQTTPQDSVFVTVRSLVGTRLPVAILRKQVKDLPFSVVINDSMAMSPDSKISGVEKVVLSARISKNGSATPQSGDLVGQTGPVDVGASGVTLKIGEVYRP